MSSAGPPSTREKTGPFWRRLPPGAVARFALLGLLLVAGFAAMRWTPLAELFTKEKMVAAMMALRAAWWAPLALLGLYLVVSPIGLPVSPLILAGGVVFGVGWGAFYNFLGTMVGASASYFLARALGRDLVLHVAPEKLLTRVEALLERHGFWTLARIRFLPIPFAVVNYGTALAGIRVPTFLGASALGLAPAMLLYTYFGHALFTVAAGDRQAVLRNLILSLILILTLTFLVPLRNAWKRRRYRSPGEGEPPR